MSKNCTPLWREAHFEVKMYKTRQLRTTFRSYDVEKLHAAVERSAFSSENVQNMSAPDHFCRSDVEKLHAAVARSAFSTENAKKLTVSEHFLKFRCRKIARRCGEKHICKSKCTKSLCFAALFEVQMSKN